MFLSEPDSIFTTEHVVQIFTMLQQYCMEFERKSDLLDPLFASKLILYGVSCFVLCVVI